MPWFDIFWNYEEGGNADHIAEHGLTPDDVEHVLQHPIREDVSGSSGRPVSFGYTLEGRFIGVVYEAIDECTYYPVTAFDVAEDDDDA